MRFKLVAPAPKDLATVERAQRAVPLVPDPEADCCARIMDRLDLPARDVARTWLTFLRALDLVEETESGFRRLRVDPTPGHLREALLEGVFGAEELLAALEASDEPLTPAAAFDALRDRVPEWEHHRRADWADVWRERTADLLDWLVLLDLAERTDEGYRPG